MYKPFQALITNIILDIKIINILVQGCPESRILENSPKWSDDFRFCFKYPKLIRDYVIKYWLDCSLFFHSYSHFLNFTILWLYIAYNMP